MSRGHGTAPRPPKAGARGQAAKPPLVKKADTAPSGDREGRRRARRSEAMRWRSRLWELSSLERVRKCGRVTHRGSGGPTVRVTETAEGRRAGLAGLQSCGSPWACPVCSRKIASERSREIAEVLGAVAAVGGCAFLVTLTMRHRAGQALVVLWAALSRAWRSVTSGRAIEREREQWGVLGYVRVIEGTHGVSGWHLHVHALVAFDSPVSVELAQELSGRWFGRWSRALVRAGLATPIEDRGGLDVRPVNLGEASSITNTAEYLAKITAEVTASYAKEGRCDSDGNRNRSPFAILRDALVTGLAEDVELWWEWEAASKNRRQIAWSKGFREWAKIRTEKTDAEIAAESLHGHNVLVIAPESWPLVRPDVADLLDAVEIGGLPAAERWLLSRGARWLPPTVRPHDE